MLSADTEAEFKTEFWKKFNGQKTLRNLVSYFVENYPYNDERYKRDFALHVIEDKLIEKKLDYRKLINLVNSEIERSGFKNTPKTSKTVTFASEQNAVSIFDADRLDGNAFQDFVAEILKLNGYSDIVVTGRSGDQGGDILAKMGETNLVIQTKRYSIDRKVTNSAVQEVLGAVGYYGCEKGLVITNSFFTRSAKDLAQVNNITLLDRKILSEHIEQYNVAKSVNL